MKKLNLLTGVTLLGIFLATGLYMKFVFRPEHLADHGPDGNSRESYLYIIHSPSKSFVLSAPNSSNDHFKEMVDWNFSRHVCFGWNFGSRCFFP
ncbi:hypothetical protein [Leptospira interrogans]|uniref:hypothetical protein n=1 Tax=Leptospira interrogans TaxID=173 RepID=UPI0012B665A4|nr:hypothetical protein [Leptospira interrogans]